MARSCVRFCLCVTTLTATTALAGKLTAAQAAKPFPVFTTDACAASPWIIPFDPGKADLGDFARERLDKLVTAWHIDAGPLLASGRVDGTEDGHFPGLSKRRLQTVSMALVQRGVPLETIWTRDDGGKQGFTENRPGVPEPQNRIVLITIARAGDQCARTLAKAQTDWLRRNCSPSQPTVDKAACDDALSRLD